MMKMSNITEGYKMKRTTISMIAAASMALSLAACKSTDTGDMSTSGTST